MQSFIRVAEIWLPSPEGDALVFGRGLYGGLGAFAELSRGVRFRRGEGLPGEAWAARHPIVMGSLKGSTFRRIEAAAAAGLTSGIAMPILAGDAIRAVVVLLCGGDAEHVGAIEVWHNDPEADAQIGLDDGYYGSAELFETTSRMTRFGRGHGLPGTVWAGGMPVVMRDLYHADRFLRREEAVRVGLNLGLGLPFDYEPGHVWVMVFLSALGTPIARRFEVWVPDGQGGLAYDAGAADAGDRPGRIAPGEGLLGRTLATGLPDLTQDRAAEAPWLAEGEGAVLSIPVLDAAGALKAVTLWQF